MTETVTVRVDNYYTCGRHTRRDVVLPAPVQVPPADEEGVIELGSWWDEVVNDETGDGHPCGSSEHAMYDVAIVAAPGRPELVGQTYSWEG